MTRYNRQDYKTAIPQIEGDVNVIQEWISSALDLFYPVGTIYETSNADFNPNKVWGGTWEKIEGKMLVGIDADDTDFDTVGETGGVKKHTHEYQLRYGGYYRETLLEGSTQYGLVNYDENDVETMAEQVNMGSGPYTVNSNAAATMKTVAQAKYSRTANVKYTSNMPPYEVVVIWKRIS